jgi:hypothetical protein
MMETTNLSLNGLIDRRRSDNSGATAAVERRQFANSHDELSPAARELAQAIDDYKMRHRRRFINCEELLRVMEQLGYQKP